jgi:hypothetical protein
MAAVVGLTIVKKFTYRGNAAEEWSNQYWFDGAIPADTAAWDALEAALVAQEKTVYSNHTFVVASYGYDSDADNAHAVYVRDRSAAPVAGTLVTGGVPALPGDTAAMLAWKTSRVNTRGKPIYLRKYYHDVYSSGGDPGDNLMTAQRTAMNALGAKLHDGTFIDGRKIRSRLHPEVILSHATALMVTTRTLKRRGKRPS